MKSKKTLITLIGGMVATAAITTVAMSSKPDANIYFAKAQEIMKKDFKAKGPAKMDRLVPDDAIKLCNQYDNNPPKEMAAKFEQEMLSAVVYPADGKYMGDWKAGNKIAQSGKGFTWKGGPVGGNCYNCHELSPKELSFGTIGTSLRNYGKLRGNSEEIQKYTYGRIYNSKAFNLCSAMPRFGQVGALKEKQIKDLVALLLDPSSPVNN